MSIFDVLIKRRNDRRQSRKLAANDFIRQLAEYETAVERGDKKQNPPDMDDVAEAIEAAGLNEDEVARRIQAEKKMVFNRELAATLPQCEAEYRKAETARAKALAAEDKRLREVETMMRKLSDDFQAASLAFNRATTAAEEVARWNSELPTARQQEINSENAELVKELNAAKLKLGMNGGTGELGPLPTRLAGAKARLAEARLASNAHEIEQAEFEVKQLQGEIAATEQKRATIQTAIENLNSEWASIAGGRA